jgi:hypothetical protein
MKKAYMPRDTFIEMKVPILCDSRNPPRAKILGAACNRHDQQPSNSGIK